MIPKNQNLDTIERMKQSSKDFYESSSMGIKEFFEHNFQILFKNQDELITATEKHQLSSQSIQNRLINEMADVLNEVDKLQKQRKKIEELTIDKFQGIEIFTEEPKIILSGNKGKKAQITLPPEQMAFIYYLAKERENEIRKKDKVEISKKWIEDALITNKKIAKEASTLYGHNGVIGCSPGGGKNGYTADSSIVRKNSSIVNKKIREYISNCPDLIRTPWGGDVKRPGQYFLAESITEVIFY